MASILTFRDETASDPSTAALGVDRQDWTAKPAVGVIEAAFDENEVILAGLGRNRTLNRCAQTFTDSDKSGVVPVCLDVGEVRATEVIANLIA
jgi:hypothetical protein